MNARKNRQKGDPKAMTNLQRQLALKKRRNDAGFICRAEWVHLDDLEALKLYAKSLRKKRFELLGPATENND